MTIYYDLCGMGHTYGNRIWIKNIDPYSDLPQLLKIVCLWGGSDRQDGTTGAESYEISPEMWNALVTIIRKRFPLLKEERDPDVFFKGRF